MMQQAQMMQQQQMQHQHTMQQAQMMQPTLQSQMMYQQMLQNQMMSSQAMQGQAMQNAMMTMRNARNAQMAKAREENKDIVVKPREPIKPTTPTPAPAATTAAEPEKPAIIIEDKAEVAVADIGEQPPAPTEENKPVGTEIPFTPFETLNENFAKAYKQKHPNADKPQTGPVVFLAPKREPTHIEKRLEEFFGVKVIKYAPGEWEKLRSEFSA